MLDLAGNTESDIDLRADRHASLTDLTVMIDETCVHSGAASTDFSVEFLGKFEQHVEVFLGAHAVTTGDHDRGALEVVLGLFHMAFEHLDHVFRFRHVLGHVVLDDFALVVRVHDFLLHHAFAHRRHLRAVFRVHDCRDDITAECRADLAKLVFVSLLHATDAHFEAVDFEFGTVGGKAAVHGAGNARA